MKVIVAGGSGYIGKALVRSLLGEGHEVVVISRRADGSSAARGAGNALVAHSCGWEQARAEVDGADVVVNLAGVPIGGPRWTASRKAAIVSSRLETTRKLGLAIEGASVKPQVFVGASGIDYYGDSGDAVVDEAAPAGSSFLAQVCVDWERAAEAVPARTVEVRTALVIGRGAPAIRLMALPFRLFAGGPLGNGRQWFPWIHVDDLVRVYRLAIEDGSLSGPVNAVAPQQLRQRDAARDSGTVLHRPALLPAPAFALRALLGEQADLLLHGQRAVSSKLGELEFRYRGLRAALEDALR